LRGPSTSRGRATLILSLKNIGDRDANAGILADFLVKTLS